MEWVLILYVIGKTTTVTTIEMESREACLKAGMDVQKKLESELDRDDLFIAKKFPFVCVSKEEEGLFK